MGISRSMTSIGCMFLSVGVFLAIVAYLDFLLLIGCLTVVVGYLQVLQQNSVVGFQVDTVVVGCWLSLESGFFYYGGCSY